MPLHGKIVVIKRSGGDGTEFPLTASCLFGRKPDCDIRIQLPQVSKEHCRIDLNENKEVILTNLSSVNPTRVNGEALQQSERLKHGDVITIIDRSFRFEYPPAPTPKKRSSTGGKVLQDQQVGESVGVEINEKRIPEISIDPHLKDGTNHDNIQRSLEKTVEMEAKDDDSLLQNKTISPFSDLYQMIKKSLGVNTPNPHKSSASLLRTPTSRFCTPKSGSVIKNISQPVITTEDSGSPKKEEVKVFSGADESKEHADCLNNGTQQAVKQSRSFRVPTIEKAGSAAEGEHSTKSEAPSPQNRNCSTPQRFTECEVIEQKYAETPKSPMRRRSKEATPVTAEHDEQAKTTSKTEPIQKALPRNSEKDENAKELSKKRKSGELATNLPRPQMKKKRVSFGGYLSPELFDKRLPPDSPLRKGASPRRSLCLAKPKHSLLRRASVIGYLKEFEHDGAKKSPKSKAPSPKAASPAKKSPKSKAPSPKATSPAKKSPKSKAPSPKATSPAKKLPKSKTPSPKATSPAKKSPKSKTPSPKAASPAKKSPKSKTPSPKAASPAKKSPKSRTLSPKAASPAKTFPKSRMPSPEVKEQPKTQCKSTAPDQVACKETFTDKRRSMVVSSPALQECAQTAVIIQDKTPLTSRLKTPTVQGRFSVSRISTPSPVIQDAVADKLPLLAVTPKIPLRRKSTLQKTPKVTKSVVNVMRRSGISRASMKVKHSWADIVKFGQTKTQVTAPAKKKVIKKATKKTVSKPQTPARKLKGHVSTGHADSPVTIVVGKAYKQKLVHPAGAAPRFVTNVAVFKKDMKMDEDLTGISEMFTTPINEINRSVIGDNVTKTPVGSLCMSVVELSVLTTPEEPGEMMVSPLGIASTVKSSEAVQRFLNADQDSSFVSGIPSSDINYDLSEQQSTDLNITAVTTPNQKPEPADCLTGVKRIMKTPRRKAEPVEDLRGKLLKTPKQKPDQQECLTGVKRIMKTPRQKAEPVEDISGKLLKTPKQKPEQQECLTGVKRIMKTPRQKAEPVEDIRGKLLKTPKQKPEQQECLTGLKRMLKTPKGLEAGDVTLDGVKELLQTPAHTQEPKDLPEMADMKQSIMKSTPLMCLMGMKRITAQKEISTPVEDMVGAKRVMETPREKGKPAEDYFGIKRLMKSPKLRGNAPVENFEGLQELMQEPLIDSIIHKETNDLMVEDQTPPDCHMNIAEELNVVHEKPHMMSHGPQNDMAKETAAHEVLDIHMEEVSSEHSSNAMASLPLVALGGRLPVENPKVDTGNHVSKQPEEESTTSEVTDLNTTGTNYEKKSLQGRRAKAAKAKQEATENLEDSVFPAPVRGRRGKKVETTAPSAVRLTRARSKDVELTMEKSAPQPSKVVFRPKRGRKAEKDQVEVQEVVDETEAVPDTESEQCLSVNVDHKAADGSASLEKTVAKPRRGRKTKQESNQSQLILEQDVPQADMAADANAEILPQVETASCDDVMKAALVQKKSLRGRRAKIVEHSEETAIPQVRVRRGKTTEATAPPVVRQTRSRNARSQKSTSLQPEAMQETEVETLVTEISAEAMSEQSTINISLDKNESAPPAEEAAVKPIKGRKTKALPEKKEVMSDQHLVTDGQPVDTVEKPRRGRKMQAGTVEEKEVPYAAETKQMQPVGRTRRGRNAKQEEKLENCDKTSSLETIILEEPVKKSQKTRKTQQDCVEPKEEIQTAEPIQDVTEAPLVAEPVSTNEQVTVAEKPRRVERKTKWRTESETPVEFTEVPAVSSDKPKRGLRGKRFIQEVEVTAELPEKKPKHELEAKEKKTAVLEPVIKSTRARGVKLEVPPFSQAKRIRRGAALSLEETNAESLYSSQISEPAKRGQCGAAKMATTMSSDQANSTEKLISAIVEDTKTFKRSVKWKADLEVFEIPKATPVKAVRGRKSKRGDQIEAEIKNVSKDINKTEDKDLSAKTCEVQPVKRARRGAKVTDEAESSNKVDPKKGAEAETQPKTRKGRAAKK